MDMLIKCNVGIRERQLRFVAGAAAAVGAYYAPEPMSKTALGVLGLFGLLTGMSRYCPLNQAFGIRHCQPAYRSMRQILRRI
jgi:hypothetical protein